MQRDILLLTEMVDAVEQAGQLTAGITVSQLETGPVLCLAGPPDPVCGR
jgi:hypothetical protein